MPNPSAASLASPTPYQLRALVLDYLCHSCYTRTASAFNKDSTVRQLDADGDEIVGHSTDKSPGRQSDERFQALLQQVRLRQEIRMHIMCGRVDDAITLLNTHFPAVLSDSDDVHAPVPAPAPAAPMVVDAGRPASTNVEYISSTSTEPAHLYLNLRILAFSEACRTVPLVYPGPGGAARGVPTAVPAPAPSMGGVDDPEYMEKQIALLTRAQKLYAYSKTLPNPADRAVYQKELENVGGLLAYPVPETSTMAKYLTQERREAVADQINRAILKRTGQPLVSSLELVTRHTQLLWQIAHEYEVKARPGVVIPPRHNKASQGDGPDSLIVPTFDLHHYLDAKH